MAIYYFYINNLNVSLDFLPMLRQFSPYKFINFKTLIGETPTNTVVHHFMKYN